MIIFYDIKTILSFRCQPCIQPSEPASVKNVREKYIMSS